MLSKNNIEYNSEFFFNENENMQNDLKQNNLSSTSVKEDSIKNFENNNFYFQQNSSKDPLFQGPIENILNVPISNVINPNSLPLSPINKNNHSIFKPSSGNTLEQNLVDSLTNKNYSNENNRFLNKNFLLNTKRKRVFNIFKNKLSKYSKEELDSTNTNKCNYLSNQINKSNQSDDDESDIEQICGSASENGDNRVSANSKVNFSKLSEHEKDERLKNLAKLVKRLRRKTRNLEQRFKKNANKILNRYLSNSLGIKKYKTNNIPLNFNIDSLSKALKMLRNYDKFEYDDQCHVIENFINLIAEEKMQFDSINFRKICTQIRLFLNKEESNYISKKGQKITFSFPEKDINITTKEYELYSKYKDKEEIIRTIIGIPEEVQNNIYPERINFENKKNVSIQNFYADKNNSNNNFSNNQNLVSTATNQIFGNNNTNNILNSNNNNNGNNTTNNGNTNFGNFRYQDQSKSFSLNKYNINNINDIVNLGMISNNGNLQNLLLNSMYSNLIQNFNSQNSAC